MFFKTRNILNKNDLTCEGTVYMKIREKVSKNKEKFPPPVPKIVVGRLEGNLSTTVYHMHHYHKGLKELEFKSESLSI